MKQILVYSEKPITNDAINELIKNEFKSYDVFPDDKEIRIYYKIKDGTVMVIEFLPGAKITDDEFLCGEPDILDKIPIKDPCITNFYFHDARYVKKALKSFGDTFGFLWVHLNDWYEWFGSSEKFIKSFRFKKFTGKLP